MGGKFHNEAGVVRIVKTLEIHSAIEEVWAIFQDVPAIAQCLPGATIVGEIDNGYKGTVEIALGPMTAQFEGEAVIRADEATYCGRIDGSGADRRGGSRGDLTLEYKLRSLPGDTTAVDIEVSVDLAGPVAQFGRTGLVDEVAGRLIADFAACLDEKLSATSAEEAAAVEAKPVGGFSLFISSLLRWIGRLLGRRKRD